MKFKRMVILSHIINEKMPLYSGEKSVILRRIKSFKRGGHCQAMHWSFPNHIGTHLDAPSHFIRGGLSVSDLLPSDLLFNKVNLIQINNISCGYVIGPKDIKKLHDCELLLIKTNFERHRMKDFYWKDSPALAPELALFLIKKCPSLRAVGIDFISVSNLKNRDLGRQTHRAFLERSILLIEDMKLKELKKAPDSTIVAPLLVEKADGAPCLVLGIYN